LSKVFESYHKRTEKVIDCLILDICYMNMVEIWYELCDVQIKNIICPIDNASLDGLSWDSLIKDLDIGISNNYGNYDILSFIVNSYNEKFKFNNGILLINLLKEALLKIKEDINDLSLAIIYEKIDIRNLFETYLIERKKDSLISINKLLELIKNEVKNVDELLLKLKERLNSILLTPSYLEIIEKDPLLGPTLFLPDTIDHYKNLHNIYSELKFSIKV